MVRVTAKPRLFLRVELLRLLLHTIYRVVTACISNVVCGDTSVNAIAGVASVGPRTQVGVCSYILSIGM